MSKISNLPNSGGITSDDYLLIVDSPGDTPASKRVVAADAKTYFSNGGDLRLGLLSGAYYDQHWLSPVSTTNQGTHSGPADRLTMVPFIIPQQVTVDRVGFVITATGTATLVKFHIYAGGANGYPDILVTETGTVAANATNLIEATISQTLSAGIYWVGYRLNGTATIRSWTSTAATVAGGMPININTANVFRYVFLSRTLAFATGATTPFAFTGISEMTANNQPPVMVMRVV